MAYHIINLGLFGSEVEPWADTAGRVPESGDQLDHMEYDNATARDLSDPDAWGAWVAAAVAATERAQQRIDAWHRSGDAKHPQ